MSELFDEVDEEVRREQFKKLWDKYSIYFIALMVLIVAAVGGWRGYQYLEAQKAAVLAFINANAELVAEFTEVESGKQGGLQPTSAPSSRRSCEAA